jgi:hypothetical protein
VSTTEELLERKSRGSGLGSRITAVGFRHADTSQPLSAKVGTNLAEKRRSIGIVRSRTQAMEFSSFSLKRLDRETDHLPPSNGQIKRGEGVGGY